MPKKTTKKSIRTRKPAKKTSKKVKKLSISRKDAKQDKEINKLKADLAKLKVKSKNKKNTKRISVYNLFIRKQIKSGLTFTKAAKEWKRYQKLTKPRKKQSAYNQFIGSQMKLGKTFTQAVRLWKLAKAGKLGKKGKTRIITKTVVKRIRSKPKVIVKRIRSKPKVITKTIIRRVKSKPKTVIKTVTKSVDRTTNEEIAFNMVEVYFKEIARAGFKKNLTLDEIINSYLYSLARVKREDIEMSEVAEAVKKSRIRKWWYERWRSSTKNSKTLLWGNC